jgi:hypothetical protein
MDVGGVVNGSVLQFLKKISFVIQKQNWSVKSNEGEI